MIAVPTRELSGHALASACARLHARFTAARFGLSADGSVTSARLRAASSGLKLSVVSTGGKEPRVVAPGAPIAPEAVGWKPSAPQSVGVILNVRWENTLGASHEFARLSDVPSAHEVGIRMNGPLLAWPLKVSAILVIWIGTPPASRGWLANVDSRPYPSGPGRM
jgi:hypothetical protein